MTHEERIAALEQELRQLRTAFAESARIHQELGGEACMYEAAVHALISSHSNPQELKHFLEENLSQVEAGAVAAAETEEHLQGVQQAQSVLMLAVSSAVSRQEEFNRFPQVP